MFRLSMPWHLPVFLLAVVASTPPADAQTPAAPPRVNDPTNAQAAVPRSVHTSAFAGYRRQTEPTPIGWKDANDTVNRIGGWRTYAREAAEPSPPAASTPVRRSAP
jgi:hypothetical protein